MPMKAKPQRSVARIHIRATCGLRSRRFAHAMTTKTDEAMSTKVLIVAGKTCSSFQPSGHLAAPVRIRISDEKSAPKSMTSEARNNQTPSFPL